LNHVPILPSLTAASMPARSNNRWHGNSTKPFSQAQRPRSISSASQKITINHGLLLFGLTESEREIRFDAYHPNLADHPMTLIYDRASRRFLFPPAIYWAGGPVSVVQIYRGGLY
jgi:hypothetical protein